MKTRIAFTIALALFSASAITTARAENMKANTNDPSILNDNINAASVNPTATSSGTLINPDNNIYPGGRSRNGLTPNLIDGSATFAANGSDVKVRRVDDTSTLSADSRIYFRGEVVNIDKNGNQIVVRNDSGATGFYIVSDRNTLNDLQRGDQVEIFR